MKRKILLGIAGTVGFVVAVTGVAIITSLVNILIPDPNKADPPGKLQESAEDKSKREWQKNQVKDTAATKEEDGKGKESQSTVVEGQEDASPPAQDSPGFAQEHTVPSSTPSPTVGPGNFDAPASEGYYNPGQGPGNM